MGLVTGSPAVSAVRSLLERAVALGASDVHLDPTEAGVRVVVRRDGVLEELETLPAALGPRLVGRLKALADLLAYRTDVPQEGRVSSERSGIGVEFRVATFPTLLGERVALRLDAPDGSPGTLDALGLPEDLAEALATELAEPEGVVLLTGPSGSGKTTTLYAGLRHIVTPPVTRSVFTVEDPVERRVDGVTQTQVNPVGGLTYAAALRSLLRQDPDVVLVGEIRDEETSSIVLEAGLTGHLVLSAIHAGTAPQVFTRLLDMGMEPFVVTTAVRGVLAQRLLRRVGPDGEYAGRVLVAEWLPVTSAVRRAILDRGDAHAIAEAARGDGYRTIREEADRRVTEGLTTREEVTRVLGTK
ncbi:MAG: GspE/PulE family protein [Planctomycetota bacterium]|jgi:type II secretory ATPase GspE/PulE/Tfp pilus assembly ATPase PilB-like protein